MRIKLDIPIALSKISCITHGFMNARDKRVEFISTDSRICREGDLFIALRGEKYDGADFTAEVRARGAYVMSCRKDADIVARDTSYALLTLAAAYKNMLPMLRYTVAVTGSVGKSTTKEFLREILGVKFRVHATRENYNNEIGMPLTVLSAPRDTEVLVLEMGMNKSGEIAMLSRCAAPDVSIITNIGTSHVGMLGTRENIALAKLEILSGMKEGGRLIVPNGEPLLEHYASMFTGINSNTADINIAPIELCADSSRISVYKSGEHIFDTILSLGGIHHLYNLSYAIAAADLLDMSHEEINVGISKISSNNSRQKVIKLDKITLIDDSYNASAESLSAAFSYLSLLVGNVKSALLSDVLELGESSVDIHRKIGMTAAALGIDKLYLFGNFSYAIAEGAIAMGMSKEKIHLIKPNESPTEFAERICDIFTEGETVLAKASHATDMNKALTAIKERLKIKDA